MPQASSQPNPAAQIMPAPNPAGGMGGPQNKPAPQGQPDPAMMERLKAVFAQGGMPAPQSQPMNGAPSLNKPAGAQQPPAMAAAPAAAYAGAGPPNSRLRTVRV